MQRIPKVLTEVGAAATIGISYMLVKQNIISRTQNKNYASYTFIPDSNFPDILDTFKRLESPHFQAFTDTIEEFLNLAHLINNKHTRNSAHFQLNRLYKLIEQYAQIMCKDARHSPNDDIITASIDCERDELDLLKKNCEIILKNVLLDSL